MKINVTNGKQPINLLVEAGTYEKKYKTAEGNPVILTDAWANYPLKSLGVNMNPIQDLHGYDHPWVGGGGKNLLPPRASETQNGVTLTWGEDGSVTFSGTATANTTFTIPFTLPANTTVTFSANNSAGISNGARFMLIGGDEKQVYLSGTNITATWTPTADVTSARFQINSGYTVSGVCYPQLELGSTATAYEPYENICPISGWSSVDVYDTGVNVWDEEWEQGDLNSITGEEISSTTYIRGVNYTPCVPNAEYYGKANSKIWLYWYDKDKNFISKTSGGFQNTTKTAPSTAHFFRLVQYASTYDNGTSINYPSTDHDYHAYNGQTITKALGQTVYGSTLNIVSGVLTADKILITPKAVDNVRYDTTKNLYWTSVAISPTAPLDNKADLVSNMFETFSGLVVGVCYVTNAGRLIVFIHPDQTLTTKEAMDAWLANNDLQFCYKLAEPQAIQLTPEAVKTLMKATILMTNADSLLVEYRTNER